MGVGGKDVSTKERVMTDEVRLQILTHLLEDKHPLLVAELVGFHPSQVHMVQHAHGWPNRKMVQSARDHLADVVAHPEKYAAAKSASTAARADTKAPQPAKAKQRAPQTPRHEPSLAVEMPPAHNRPAGGPVGNPRPSSPGSLTDLIERGRASKRAKTRQVAERLVVTVQALKDALVEDERETAEEAAKRAEEQRVRDEIAALERQLAALRQSPVVRPTGRKAQQSNQRDRLTTLGVTLSDVRTWANANGFTVPPTTAILRADVLDAYEAAHK